MDKGSLFQFSVNNALEMVIVFDDKGKIVYANKAALKDLDYDEDLCGNHISEVFTEFHPENKEYIESKKDLDEVYNIMAYRKNRTCFPVKAKILVYDRAMDMYGELMAYTGECIYVCIAFDVSTESFLERKVTQADQETEAAQKVKSEFVANVTHELRTPVNGILGNTQELISIESDKDKLKLLRLVERGCRDMNSIINNILDFSKLEAGKFILEPRSFHFRNMIDYVKGNHSNRIIEKGLELSITISPDIPEYVIGDELRLVQVLNNLISNAYKFTSVGGIHIEALKTAQSGNRIELFFMVIDTGIGIAKNEQDKLFKSFSQVDASISRKYGGTGLGLNICKQLVELMGGQIHVQSEKGKGTMFSFDIWVELPIEEYGYSESTDMELVPECTVETGESELLNKLQQLTENYASEKKWIYGEKENKEEVDSKMSKLILSIEMDSWEKAELFAETVKKLLDNAPREITSAALRLKMAVQKGDYERAVGAFENLKALI